MFLSQAGISAAVEQNPWQIIAAQNVFRLRPFSVPEEPIKETPRKAAPKMIITGMTDLGGRRQALAEILEPGKPLVKPILTEGDRFGSLEVLQIDVDHNRVKVRIDGRDSELFLEAAYPSAPARRSGSATSP